MAIDCRNTRGMHVMRDDGNAHVTAAVRTLLNKAESGWRDERDRQTVGMVGA